MTFERILEIDPPLIASAVATRESFRAFLDRAVAVSRPEEGAPKLLMACAALAAAPWVDGALRVELEGDEHETRIGLLVDAGFRERLFPVMKLNVPFDEFARAVRLVPRLIEPLIAQTKGSGIVLKPKPPEDRPSTRPTRRMNVVDGDVHTKKTVTRMAAVRPDEDE